MSIPALAASDLAAALHVLATAVADDPRDHEARAHLATLQHAAGLLDDALANFRQVAESGFGGYEFYNNLRGGGAGNRVSPTKRWRPTKMRLRSMQESHRARQSRRALGAAGRVDARWRPTKACCRMIRRMSRIYVGIAQLFIAGLVRRALAVLESASPFGAQNPSDSTRRASRCAS